MRLLARALLVLAALVVGCRKDAAPVPEVTPAPTAALPERAPRVVAAAVDVEAAKGFWTWFASHAAQAQSITNGEEPIAGELGDQLRKVDPDLTFEIGPKGATRELVISADGKKRAFAAVKAVVAAAPAVPGWRVIAFRQRKPFGLTIDGGGAKLDPKGVWFRAERNPGRPELIALTVFIQGLAPANEEALGGAMFLLLDSLLGEYDVETKLGAIDPKPAPADKQGLRPLSELPAVVDGWK